MKKSVQQIAKEALDQAKAEGLDDEDAKWMAVGAVNREARKQGVIPEDELPAEMNAASQAVVDQVKKVGRPKSRKGTYISTTIDIREDLLKKIDASGKSRREYIEHLLEK